MPCRAESNQNGNKSMLNAFRLLLRVRRLERRNKELVSLVQQIYDWTDHKHTSWARRANAAIAAAKAG